MSGAEDLWVHQNDSIQERRCEVLADWLGRPVFMRVTCGHRLRSGTAWKGTGRSEARTGGSSANLEGTRRAFQAEGATLGKGSVVGGSEVFQGLHHSPVQAVPHCYCDTHFIGS